MVMRIILLTSVFLLAACQEFIVTTTDDIDDGVCNQTHCSLREAVTAANQSAGEDVIRVPAGVYLLTRTGDNEDNNKVGDLDVTEDVLVIGEGVDKTIFDGNNSDRVFHVLKGRFGLTQATVQHGKVTHDYGYGGGIYAAPKGSLTLATVAIKNNWSASKGPWGGGGGVYSFGSVDISDSEISGNFSYHQAGGIGIRDYEYDEPVSNLHLQRVKIMNNGSYGHGGGLYILNATSLIEHSLIEGNKASPPDERLVFGGGIYHLYGSLAVNDSAIKHNWVKDYGGGVYSINDKPDYFTRTVVDGNASFGSRGDGGGMYVGYAHIEDSSITRNEASGIAGGLSAHADTMLRNVTISNNKSRVGAVAFYNGVFTLDYVTIANNKSTERTAGIFMRLTSELWPSNSIIANNTLNGATHNCEQSGPINSVGNNIADDNNCNFTQPSDIIGDPMLLPLAHAGYNTTEVHPLQEGSPAINSADLKNCADHDQTGYARPVEGQCDRGAFEYRKRNDGDVITDSFMLKP